MPVSKQCHEKILEQMNTTIYELLDNDISNGFCIFCYIKNKNTKIPVMITTYEIYKIIINKNLSQNHYNITISLNNENQEIEIIDINYINKENNISIIKIKDNKENKLNFIELDDNLYENDSKINYYNKSLYIINYNDKNNISVSYGIIKDILNSDIIYIANRILNTRFSLIFNLNNNKLIGIFRKVTKCYNRELLLKFIIKEVIKEYNKNKGHNNFNLPNEINLLVKVYKNQVNEKIFFLDNYEYFDNKGRKHNHDNLNELNESNTELYINNDKFNYEKYFIPKEEGVYEIKLKLFIYLTDCSYMFAGCKNIININFFSFKTKFITNMEFMFYKCKYLKNLNLLLFDTKNVISMCSMFKKFRFIIFQYD